MLYPIADDIWAFDQDLRLPGGMLLPTRTTLLRRRDGGIVVHSPLGIDDGLAEAIAKIGDVRTLVAPSCIHFLFLKGAMDRYPKAQVLGAPGLAKKLPGVRFEPLPSSGAVEALGDGVRVRQIEGFPYITEHVFLHEASRTLIVTDFIFNLQKPCGFGTKFFLFMVGAYKRPAQSRFWRFLVRDRRAASRSIEDVLGWSFDCVVVGHGDVVTESAREHIRRAGAWLGSDSPLLLGAGGAAT